MKRCRCPFPRTAVHRVCAWALLALLGAGPSAAQDLGLIGQRRPFSLLGSVAVQGGPYFYAGDGEARNKPFFWNSTGTLTFSLWGWQAPFSFSVGSQERSWTQPFNRYGLSPHYKWIRLHLGYRTMRFNPYTFAGLQFFGGGLELEPKGFRFAAFYGRFNRPVAQDTLGAIIPVPTYRRMGMGVRIGAGGRRTFVDVMVFHAADDPSSIPTVSGGNAPPPMENLAVGVSGRIALSRQVSWEFDGGASAITEDTRLPLLDIEGTPAFTQGIFKPRLSTRLLFAGNTSLRWTSRHLDLRAQYKEVEPNYRSLGAFYQQTDLRAITIEPSMRLFRSKLRVGGSYGIQQDNIRNTKQATSTRRIGSAHIAWNPGRGYGLDVGYSNYGIAQEAGLQVLNDTFRVAQSNRNITVSQRVMLIDRHRTWTITLAGGFQQLEDLNPFGTYASAENEVTYANLYVGRIRQRDNLSVSGGLNAVRNRAAFGETLLLGPSLGFSRPFSEQRVTLSLSASYNMAYTDGAPSGNTINGTGNLQYRVGRAHRFQFTVTALQNRTSFVTTREFTEVRIMGGYVLTFQTKPGK